MKNTDRKRQRDNALENILIHNIRLRNLLSFGPNSQPLTLGPLNIMIGPNGCGKSNLIQAIDVLHHAPQRIQDPISKGGGITEWIWNGAAQDESAQISLKLPFPEGMDLEYHLEFKEQAQRFHLIDECLSPKPLGSAGRYGLNKRLATFYRENGSIYHSTNLGSATKLEDIDANRSILSQRSDPEHFPFITYLAKAFEDIKIYNNWHFGPKSTIRRPCPADAPNEFLETDLHNLPLVLNYLHGQPLVKKQILKYLRALYDGIEDFGIRVANGTGVVTLQEGDKSLSGFRLSDGTLRYLCLLAILCHPKPPRLICIEEPELGLHPDLISTVAELLTEASKRAQIIVTTHSDLLVDAMTDTPEAVIVCEKYEDGTQMKRLDPEELAPWLEDFRLGNLWTSGDIGGNRW